MASLGGTSRDHLRRGAQAFLLAATPASKKVHLFIGYPATIMSSNWVAVGTVASERLSQ